MEVHPHVQGQPVVQPGDGGGDFGAPARAGPALYPRSSMRPFYRRARARRASPMAPDRGRQFLRAARPRAQGQPNAPNPRSNESTQKKVVFSRKWACILQYSVNIRTKHAPYHQIAKGFNDSGTV